MTEEEKRDSRAEAEGRRTHRGPEDVRRLANRLSRVEGQVRGIRGMLEKDAYCVDILTQVMAVQAALNAFSRDILGNHIRGCVAEGIRAGDDEIIDELVLTVQKIMK